MTVRQLVVVSAAAGGHSVPELRGVATDSGLHEGISHSPPLELS